MSDICGKDILDILLEEDEIFENQNPKEEHEVLLSMGIIPEDARIDNSYSNGQTALHIVVRSEISWIAMENCVPLLLKLGVDPEAKDKDGLTCTTITYNWAQEYAVRTIENWILLKYPRVWDHSFFKKYKEMIFRNGHWDYCYEIVKDYEQRCFKAMSEFTKQKV